MAYGSAAKPQFASYLFLDLKVSTNIYSDLSSRAYSAVTRVGFATQHGQQEAPTHFNYFRARPLLPDL